MTGPLVSVIVSTYRGAHFIPEALASLLRQTYRNWEALVVDDASPDNTGEVVSRYQDTRIRYFRHEHNAGVLKAWLTGLHESRGELIACLDQDDAFHPDKLRLHVDLHLKDREVGFSYNGRFETGASLEEVREIWEPPARLAMRELVLGFPFAPSDMVLARRWAFEDGIWEDSIYTAQGEETIVNGSEIIYCGRLFLAGCRFAAVSRALNYRRHPARRRLSDLALRCRSEIACQSAIVQDSRCPADVTAARELAFANTYLSWASVASWQDAWELAKRFLEEAIRCDPALLAGDPAPVVLTLLSGAMANDDLDHEQLLRGMFHVLPLRMENRQSQLAWCIARGYAIKGARALMWGRIERGCNLLRKAAQSNVHLDEALVGHLAAHLLTFRREFGAKAADAVVERWRPHFSSLSGPLSFCDVVARYRANLAFERYRGGDYSSVPAEVFRAVCNDRRYARDRGMLSITARSLAGMLRNAVTAGR